MPIRTFQIGLEWFPERGGGLDRYYHDLVTLGHGDTLAIAGSVAGDGGAERETQGRVTSFASAGASLPQRLGRARRAIRRGIAAQHSDVVASHFALHALPLLDRIDRPFVVHFHGPWAAEASTQRGSRRIANAAQRWMERRVYRRADRVIVLSDAFARLVHRDRSRSTLAVWETLRLRKHRRWYARRNRAMDSGRWKYSHRRSRRRQPDNRLTIVWCDH